MRDRNRIVGLALVGALLMAAVPGLAEEPRTSAAKQERTKKLDDALRRAPILEATQVLDQAIVDMPWDKSLPGRRIDIVRRLLHEQQPEQAAVQGEILLKSLLEPDSVFSRYGGLPFASYQVAKAYDEMGRRDQGLETLRRAEAAIEAGRRVHPSPALETAWLRQQANMALWFAEHEDYVAGDRILEREQARLEHGRGAWSPNDDVLANWIYVIQFRVRVASQSGHRDVASRLTEQLDRAIRDLAREYPDSSQAIQLFLDVRLEAVDRSYRDDPERTRDLIRQTLVVVDRREFQDAPLLTSGRSRLVSYEAKIDAALLAKSLVGKPAPALRGAAWAAGASTIPRSLEGKIVVVDFWALWCGPCVAALPELDRLQKEFHEKGVEVVGVTRCYGFEWDTEANEPVNRDNMQLEKEVDAVDRFLKSKKASFPSLVDPHESPLFTSFGVTGIPQTVVIDRQGVIRLIQVGHTEANRNALRDLLSGLLAVEPSAKK